MKLQPARLGACQTEAFVVLLIVFGLVVLGAIVTIAKYVETHQAEQHPVKAKRAG